jgi:hypothetical protein
MKEWERKEERKIESALKWKEEWNRKKEGVKT